jgi:drug/metabolite transporter (DMT)-like permease
MLGYGWGQISVVAVLVSLYSSVTVLLAWLFLRDKLQWSQWVGIFIIFSGIVLINL